MEDAEPLFSDFKSAPHKKSDIEVFAAYALKMERLHFDDENSDWPQFYDGTGQFEQDEFVSVTNMLATEFPDDQEQGDKTGDETLIQCNELSQNGEKHK